MDEDVAVERQIQDEEWRGAEGITVDSTLSTEDAATNGMETEPKDADDNTTGTPTNSTPRHRSPLTSSIQSQREESQE